MRTYAVGAAVDGVPTIEEKVDDPRSDEDTGTGDARDDTHRAMFCPLERG